MTTDVPCRMPEDWNDHAGWETWYRYWAQDDPLRLRRFFHPFRVGCITADSLSAFVSRWRAAGWSEVWTPGCGMDPLGHLLAHFGMKVTATDTSPTAVDFQNSERGGIDAYVEQYDLGPAVEGGSFRALVHDFRTGFAEEAFDLIHNLNAFQLFPEEDMVRIAQVHARALKPGCVAIFDPIEQGDRLDAVERAVEAAGLCLPGLAYARRLRETLAAEGIPVRFVRMGYQGFSYSLTVPAEGEFADEARRREAIRRVGAVQKELEPFGKAQAAAEDAAWTPQTKMAELLLC
jgi:SAM-dependent methyltransferase